jgi:hypothetical protein
MATRMRRADRPDAIAATLPTRDEVLAALTDKYTLPEWINVPPPPSDVRWMAVQVANRANPAAAPEANEVPFGRWAGSSASTEDRNGLLLDVLAVVDDASTWIEAVAPHGVDEEDLVAAISRRVQAESKGQRRAHLARNLVALRPNDKRAKEGIANLMIWLLARKLQADLETAARLIQTVSGIGQRLRGDLAKGFEKCLEANLTLPKARLSDLREFGIVTKKKSLIDRLLRDH